MRELVEDLRIGVAQLMSDSRLDARERNIIFSIAPDSPIRQFLASTRKDWNDTRPEIGPHPKGDIHLYTWKLFVLFIEDSYASASIAPEPPIAQFLAELKSDDGKSVARFLPLSKGGRPGLADKPWLWQFGGNVTSDNGMPLQRQLLRHGDLAFKPCNITVRNDTCPVRKIEKRIANSTVL